MNTSLFGDNHLPHLRCFETKEKILSKINQEITKTNLIKLTNSNSNKLEKGYFVIGIPKDSLEIYLYFCQFNGKNACFLIEKQIQAGFKQPKIIQIQPNISNPEKIYDGTLIEASRIYVKDKNERRYVIILHDIIMCSGINISNEFFIERLKRIGHFLENLEENFRVFPFRMQIVNPFENLRLFERRIINYPYKIDRYTFVSQFSRRDRLYYDIV